MLENGAIILKTSKDIQTQKVVFSNKVRKAERLCKSDVTEITGDVCLDFLKEIVDLHKDMQDISKDYLQLYDFMVALDKVRLGQIKKYKSMVNEKAQESPSYNELSLAYDDLQLDYDTLLKKYKEVVAENKELIEFKGKFLRSKKVDDDLICSVNRLREQGLSTRAIGKDLGISNCTVSKILNNKY